MTSLTLSLSTMWVTLLLRPALPDCSPQSFTVYIAARGPTSCLVLRDVVEYPSSKVVKSRWRTLARNGKSMRLSVYHVTILTIIK